VLLLAAGCDVGKGTGSVTGSVMLSECTTDTAYDNPAFNLNPTYFVADPVDDLTNLHPQNRVSIRVQSAGNLIEEADGVFFNVSDVAMLANQLGQPVAVGPNTLIRASLGLYRTCPKRSVEMELDGTITFTKFGSPPAGTVPESFSIKFGDPLAANFSFTIVDRRALTLGGSGNVTTAPEASGNIAGNFDFIVRQGRAAQAYP
jgi:hypothetical protein